MYLRELKLHSFRNYAELRFLPRSGLNILVGENAQGKSNILEAIYLLATTRSLRASKESELITHGEEAATVWADLSREKESDVELDLSVHQTDKKSVKVNGAKRGRVLEMLGNLNAVYFGAQEMGIVSGEPSLRRRYLNIEISQISPKYVFDLGGYKKALEQRNRLLRDLRDRSMINSGLEAWDEQIVRYGTPLIEKRRFFIERLSPLANEIHRSLTDAKETLDIRYQPSVPLSPDNKELADLFRCEIKKLAAEEIRRGVTLLGPQRDEIQFTIDGTDARSFGSMGQMRTVVLSVKLAQYRLMEDYVGEPPILLLDDVMSDLDDLRRSKLLEWIRAKGQTFVTCTSLRAFPKGMVKEADVFTVAGGTVERAGSA